LAGLLFLTFTVGAYAQNKEPLGRIAILPFSGGSRDEQEGIPELLSFTPGLMQNFLVIPRTGITNAARQEQSFQATSGMTNADTIAKLGNQFSADYVMAGSITSLGSKNLLIVSIVKIDAIRQVAGVYLTYDSLDELNRDDTIMQVMAAELVEMVRRAANGLDRLALLPVELADGGNTQEGDALAQILAIHLLNIGKYGVYPRTGTLDQVQSEYRTQLEGGVTREDEAVKAGSAVNPSYVLSVISRKIGTGTRFNASIIDLERGISIEGNSEQYANLSDGITAMEFLAMKLSGQEVSEVARTMRTRTVEEEINDETRAERARARAVAMDNFLKNAGIAIGGWYGFGLSGTATKRVRSTDTTANLTINGVKYKQDSGSYGGANVELRLFRYFGIQTGISGITDYAPYTPQSGVKQYAKLSFIQIPILARFNFSSTDLYDSPNPEIGLLFSIFGGLGINTAVNSPETESADPGGTSLIAGLEVGIGGQKFGVFTGYQWNGANAGSLTVNGVSYIYTRGNHIMYLGAKFYLPFRN
jgi:hypothetical protein